MNEISKEMIYVLEGSGEICLVDGIIEFTEGDAILIDKNEKYYWDSEYCKVAMICTPAWTEKQHKLVG